MPTISALYADWQHQMTAAKTDEDISAAATIEARMNALPPVTAADFAMKLLVVTGEGGFQPTPQLIEEARALARAAEHRTRQENPDLLQAYSRLVEAVAKRTEAENALEWLADEWRHRWPLAPEPLLGAANADSRLGGSGNELQYPERDMLGNYLKRETSVLTKRLSKKFRQEGGRLCFYVFREEWLLKSLEFWRAHEPRGRTPKALQSNAESRLAHIARLEQEIVLAREYERDTTIIRETSGVDRANQRVKAARITVNEVCDQISRIPAFTHEGLRIKAAALNLSNIVETFAHAAGLIGEMVRFAQAYAALNSADDSGEAA